MGLPALALIDLGLPGADLNELIEVIAFDRLHYAVLLGLVGWGLLRLVTRFLDDLGERLTDRRLTLKKAKALTQFFFYLAIALVVGAVGLNLDANSSTTALGALFVGLSFAGKDLLASLMSGVILLLDAPFQVGDRITFGQHYGEVTEIGLRSVKLVTLDDSLVTIPNSRFLSETVSSANAGALDCMIVVPFYIGAAEDFDVARRMLLEVAATSRYVFLDKPFVTTIADEFLGERFCTVLRVKAYVFDARFEKAFVSDLTERAKRAFRSAGIRTPDQVYRDLEIVGKEWADAEDGPIP